MLDRTVGSGVVRTARGVQYRYEKGLWFLVFCCVCILAVGCSGKQVTRLEEDTTVDLSGRWNDSDSRLVAEAMIEDCLSHPWITQHMQRDAGDLPVVIAGAVRNLGTEHIAVGTFVADIERALINSGRARVVASPTERGDVRLERADQWANASQETVKQLGQELGADYMMVGTINTITDSEDGKRVVFYQTDLSLIDIGTNQKVWVGQKKIKKFIGRGKYKP
ncbi:MAG: penicillin-binding protein activator LpoB [Candidatus Eisenbacteria bacterium]|nr:penicillin-binding protein activator LpoB [Candidatus Eisenbacteria bacterium]